jgi:hypothetical protein
MKRSAALAPLSRDHQHALDAALRLRRADRETASEAIGHFQRFFAREGRRHFAIEEQLLLPALPADDAEWAPCVARVRDDHEAIRAGATALEERAVFEMLERRLTASELERLGNRVADAEGQRGAPPPQR